MARLPQDQGLARGSRRALALQGRAAHYDGVGALKDMIQSPAVAT